MKPKQADNGASPIIDALLIRMSELDRFSDDECVLTNKELLPFDVVTSKSGQFGFIGGNKYWQCHYRTISHHLRDRRGCCKSVSCQVLWR